MCVSLPNLPLLVQSARGLPVPSAERQRDRTVYQQVSEDRTPTLLKCAELLVGLICDGIIHGTCERWART
jgi:hypothetical protein